MVSTFWTSLLFLAGSSVNASTVVNRGTFASPRTGVKWRYWIEDASLDLDTVRFDISEMARVGSAGFELLSYQSYGSILSFTGLILLDPSAFAFGSDRFVDVTASVVQAAIDNNLTIDFTVGPNQGAGVPVHPDDIDAEGMNTELVFGSHFLAAGETFDGPIPQPETFPLLRFDDTIASANTSRLQLVGLIGAQVTDGANTSSTRVSLDFNTIQDLTSQVKVSGNSTTVSWTPSSNGTNVLLSYFSRRNGYPEARPGFNGPKPNEPGSWGSWAIDHFSPKGVNISTSFIQNNILSKQNIGEMLSLPGVGQYMWEDSMEYQAQVFWTDAFAERFMERHGYEVNVTLPVLHTLPSNAQTTLNQTFDYGTTFNWDKFTEDYQDTLTSLYLDYISEFSEWSHSIGMSFSNQPAYNLRLDTAASAAIPDAPEIESFGVPTIDGARQLSGGVHLGNRTIFSSELGARVYEANSIRMVELLQDANTQYAGGVNVVMLHGFPYSGYYPNTTWPGFTTVGYVFADMHGPRMPAWDHYKDYLDYLARTQYVLQAGVAKVDIGIYRKGYDIDFTSPPYGGTSQLISSGYTYEYVSPENLKLPGVTVSNSRLASYGPAYKAFILGRQQNITVDAARRLVEYAQQGLPIILVADVPSDIPGYEIGNASMSQVQSLMSQLTAEPTVVVVDDEDDVPSTLVSLGVLPAVSSEPPSLTLFSVVRQTNDKSGTKTAFFFLFNQGNSAINTTLTLNPGFTGSPFALDPWSGVVTPVVLYSSTTSGKISIPDVSLASNQTALFAVTSGSSFEGVPVPDVHITSAEPGVTAVLSNAYTSSSRHIQLRSFKSGSKQFFTRAGERKTADFSLKGETSRVLSGWRLNITAWTPPEDLSEPKSVLVRHSPIDLTEGLVPWNQIDGLANVSGVGTYVTSFEWAHAKDGAVGLLLDFGEIFHTVRAWLNGRQITTADPAHPVVDISDLVVHGSNTIRIDAASTLLNAINAVPEVETLGQTRLSILLTLPENQQYGLISNVTLVPYARVTISM
ncbi:hypothetical protein F5878DRAFT_207024 [Lentinula raphanica]|uniref:Secreted protein n=1 Tax=Lentinula raphanica TaxID=153919 RepID=A0AA38UNJ9_9AGAR|nr:hypothetical protein F5878DRAFT_207024 [Lentinula raphanica]